MADRKAVVLEVKERTMVVMTGDGEFIRLPRNAAARPGEVISLPPRRRRIWPVFFAAAAVILLCLSATLYGPAVIQPAAAYVDLELGGSLRLTLDHDGHVRRVEALDETGKAILKASDLGSRPDLNQAVANLVEGAVSAEKLKPGDPALAMATLVPADGDKSPVDVSELRASIASSLAGRGIGGQVLVVPATPDQYKEARRQGLSTGRWLAAQQGRRQGAELSREDLKKDSLPAVLERHRLKAEDLFPGASSPVQSGKQAASPDRDGMDTVSTKQAGKETSHPGGPRGNATWDAGAPWQADGKNKTADDAPGKDKDRKNGGRSDPWFTHPGQEPGKGRDTPSPPVKKDKDAAPHVPDNDREDNARRGAKGPPQNGKGLHN